MILQIVLALVILGILIFVHEMGHFVAAKLFNIPVSEFALGMGPQILSYEGKETTYSLRAIPIGGFVNIEGMEIDSEVKDGFNSKHPLKRFVVLFAGVFMNFTLAFLIIFVNVKFSGIYVPSNEPVIGFISETSPGIEFLLPQDKIIKINGQLITNWDEIKEIINADNEEYLDAREKTVTIEIERNNEIENFQIITQKNLESDEFLIGIGPERFLDTSLKRVFQSNGEIYTMMISGLKSLFAGQVKKSEVSGPIGIVRAVGEFSQNGIGPLAFLAALLSINLGLLNLLPFPALDGGRIVFVILEFFGIKIKKNVEEKLHYVGMFVLFALIFLISVNDVVNIFQK